MSSFTYGSRTDVGRVRQKNQDSIAVVPSELLSGRADGLFVVADGMGGHAGGEIASRVAVETLRSVVTDELAKQEGDPTVESMTSILREGISAANEAVWKQGRANPELRGMGTTCVAVLVRGGLAAVGNVGDSRAYLLRDARLRQITDDHSLVQEHVRSGEMTAEEARGSRFRNVITRGIGLASGVEPDVELVDLESGDTLLLCSDGLSTMVRDDEIRQQLAAIEDPQAACDRLVDAANRNGGEDNISTLVIRYGDFVPAEIVDGMLPRFEDSMPLSLPRRRVPAVNSTSVVLVTLLLVVTSLMVIVVRESYDLIAGWPFLRRKEIKAEPSHKTTPPSLPRFADFVYAAPVVVPGKAVRSAPLACDPDGNLYAVTAQTGTIIRVSADRTISADFPAKLPAEQPDSGIHWAVDLQGNLYASFRGDHVIRKYTPAGTRIAEIGQSALTSPGGIAVDGKGNVYVVDRTRILRFTPRIPAAPASGSGTGNPAPGSLSVEARHGAG